MNDAELAISEILTALSEYGSDITLRKVTHGSYNPLTGATEVNTDTPVKALINRLASESVSKQISGNEAYNGYEMSITFYHTEAPNTSWKVVFMGIEYKIILAVPYILQNTAFKYEVLVKR